jgi:hypothetical protein
LFSRTQGHVETVQWSDQWEEELKTKIHGTEGCTITNQRGTRLLGSPTGPIPEVWERGFNGMTLDAELCFFSDHWGNWLMWTIVGVWYSACRITHIEICSINGGTPKNGWSIVDDLIKMDDLGTPF